MPLFGIKDIRLFWNKSESISDQFSAYNGDFKNFKFIEPVRKANPTPFDIAFWIPENFNEMDFFDIVRSCDTEDMIEDVSILDVFTHPKTGRVCVVLKNEILLRVVN
jgi:phenylalanyl-tRNA synthetase alpha chain